MKVCVSGATGERVSAVTASGLMPPAYGLLHIGGTEKSDDMSRLLDSMSVDFDLRGCRDTARI